VTDLWISVLIPTYNRCDSLRVTLDALGRQTMPAAGFEVLTISDGSTDGTDAMLAGYSAPYRLIPLTQSNAGPAAARNQGIDAASGELIVLLDDDVEPAPNFLEAHAARHRRGDVDDRLAIFGPMLRDPERQEPSWIRWEHAMLEKNYKAWETGTWSVADAYDFHSGNASFRREWAVTVGGFDVDLMRMEDIDLGLRMQRECGVHFEFDPTPVGIHRPLRSYRSWLSVAEAYGKLDIVHARAGETPWERVRDKLTNRNAVTLFLTDVVLSMPAAGPALRSMLSAAAHAVDAVGLTGLSMPALSVVYNLRYLECAAAEMGAGELRRLMKEADEVTSAYRIERKINRV